MRQEFTLKSHSVSETRKIGQVLGRALKNGDTVLLEGALGTGKTTLVQGIAKGFLGPSKFLVTSPTFSLIHEYDGRSKLFHMDWYRLDSVSGEDEELALECLGSERALSVVEWPERGKHLLPREYLKICLKHRGGDTRFLAIAPRGKSYRRFIPLIKSKLAFVHA